MAEATSAHIDIADSTFQTDPYPVWARLRQEGHVHRLLDFNGMDSWLISHYEDARAALADGRLSKDSQRIPQTAMRFLGGPENPLSHNMLSTDPPDHTRLRRIVSKAFTPRRIEERLRPRVQEITDELLDAMAGGEAVDLVEALAFPLPVIVICELLGVPTADREQFRDWSNAIIAPGLGPEGILRSREGARAMGAYMAQLVAQRRASVRTDLPEDEQPDLVSVLIAAHDEGGALDDRELIAMLVLLLIAGHETTVNLISVGMLALFQHPDQLRLLRDRPELAASAVEELLRYTNPVQRGSFRFAVEDIEIGGVTIPAGSPVSVGIAASNRDGERFPEPDRVDITRTDNQHNAFGHGVHFCLGAPLARQEGQIAFTSLLQRFPDIALAVPVDHLRYRASGILRGLEALPVRLRPALSGEGAASASP